MAKEVSRRKALNDEGDAPRVFVGASAVFLRRILFPRSVGSEARRGNFEIESVGSVVLGALCSSCTQRQGQTSMASCISK